jgi:hypothetical protein
MKRSEYGKGEGTERPEMLLEPKATAFDAAPRRNRLDELVWVLTDCGARDASRATIAARRPPNPIPIDDATAVVADALVRLGRLPALLAG